MKKLCALIMLVVILCGMVCGCGKKNKKGETTLPTEAIEAETVVTEPVIMTEETQQAPVGLGEVSINDILLTVENDDAATETTETLMPEEETQEVTQPAPTQPAPTQPAQAPADTAHWGAGESGL